MFAHLNPHSSDFGDVCALHAPFLHQLTVQSSLFEPGCPVLVVVCVALKLRLCPSYGRRRDRINLGSWRSLYKGGRGTSTPIHPAHQQHCTTSGIAQKSDVTHGLGKSGSACVSSRKPFWTNVNVKNKALSLGARFPDPLPFRMHTQRACPAQTPTPSAVPCTCPALSCPAYDFLT